MAIGQASLAGARSATDAASYATASITPTANRLVLAFVGGQVSSGTPNVPTLTGNGLTWVQVATISYGSGLRTLTLFRAMGAAPTAGAVTIDFAAQTQTNCDWSISEFSGVDTSGTNGSGAIVQAVTNSSGGSASGSVTLAAATDSVNNRPVSAFRHSANEATTERTNWTEIHDVAGSNAVSGLESQWRSDAFETAASATWTTSTNYAGIAAEINSADAAVSPPAAVTIALNTRALAPTLSASSSVSAAVGSAGAVGQAPGPSAASSVSGVAGTAGAAAGAPTIAAGASVAGVAATAGADAPPPAFGVGQSPAAVAALAIAGAPSPALSLGAGVAATAAEASAEAGAPEVTLGAQIAALVAVATAAGVVPAASAGAAVESVVALAIAAGLPAAAGSAAFVEVVAAVALAAARPPIGVGHLRDLEVAGVGAASGNWSAGQAPGDWSTGEPETGWSEGG